MGKKSREKRERSKLSWVDQHKLTSDEIHSVALDYAPSFSDQLQKGYNADREKQEEKQ
jgi:hypothetical protein